jgi:hypothetical protein
MLLCASLVAAALHAAPAASLPLALREVNPDKLSGGLFLALDAAGAFGAERPVTRARAGFPDISKGRPPAVLDARVGVNVRVGDDPAALLATQRGQAEPHLYRSAVNPDLLLACFQEGRFAENGGALSCGYGISRDAGLTWTRALIPQLTTASGGPYLRATDPVAAIGPQGDLYLNTLGSLDNAFGLAAVVVSRSTNSGATWSAPAVVFQGPNPQVMPDKNWMAVNDFPGSPNAGRLVVTWTNFTSNAAGNSTGNNVVAAVSDDRGLTWSAPVPITPAGSNNQGTQPVFLHDGSLAVIYITFLGGTTSQFSIQCKRSVDGGRTFPGVATSVVGLVNAWDDPELRDGVFLPSATAARDTGELFVTYTAVIAGVPRVLVTKSIDAGTTWSAPVVVSNNTNGASVMNPAVVATPSGRTVAVVFMDKRLAPNRAGFVDHFAALSFDGGATWQPNLRLSEVSSDIKLGPQTSRGVMLGDYLGLVAPFAEDQGCVAAWCDTRTGDSDPFAARFAPVEVSNYGAWSIARVVPGPMTYDEDGDGDLNYLEFVNGTDPRVAEPGDDLVLRRSSPNTLDIFWSERATVQKSAGVDGVSLVRVASLETTGFATAPTLTASLPVAELPNVPLREGLAWRGLRTALPAEATAVARTFRQNATLPARAGTHFATIGTDARLINLSTRGQVMTGVGQLIVGFVLDGTKSILVRAAGPALAALGINNTLPDPRLRLEAPASDLFVTNDNWQQGTASTALFARLGAFPFPANSLDAAHVQTLGIQAYTAIVSGATSAPGIALVEAYDADPLPGNPANPRLLNLSTRGAVGTGENALIAGFVLAGTQPRRVLVRAAGPSLANFNVTGELADPVLTLYRDQTPLAVNDDWERSRSGAAVAAMGQRVGAFPLNAASRDAALLVTLAPGNYTAVVTGVEAATGIGLIEVYDVD